MTATTETFCGTGSIVRGIHPPDGKHFAQDAQIEVVPTPARVVMALSQHIGAPATSVVKSRQEVALGEVIGEAGGFVSAQVHASVAGTVAAGSVATLPHGAHVQTVPIKASEDQLAGRALFEDVFGGEWPKDGLEKYDSKQVVEAVSQAGIVGQGGAAFPTHVKLMHNEKRPIGVLIINGCECEPFLTADYRLMLEAPAPIITGAILAGRAQKVSRILVVIEDNKPAAIESMRQAAAGTDIEIVVLKTKYPMGGEKQTILAVTGRVVPTGGLPLDVGVVVMNVGTAAAVARAVIRSKPLTHRVVTISGAGIARPSNLLVPVGISYGELIGYCGGLTAEASRIISGGPMMGFAVADLTTPVTKGTSGLTILTDDDVRRSGETNCIRCGRCVDGCPVNLVPTRIALASRAEDWDLARRYHIAACIECGCCAYVCPASIPLVQLIRAGKARMPR